MIYGFPECLKCFEREFSISALDHAKKLKFSGNVHLTSKNKLHQYYCYVFVILCNVGDVISQLSDMLRSLVLSSCVPAVFINKILLCNTGLCTMRQGYYFFKLISQL